jgi:hypothetical protein
MEAACSAFMPPDNALSALKLALHPHAKSAVERRIKYLFMMN